MLKNAIKFIGLTSSFMALPAIGTIGTIAAVIGIANGLNSMSQPGGLFGGSPSGQSSSMPYYTPSGLSTANQAWLNSLSNLQGNAYQTQQASPYLAQSFNQMLGVNPSGMIGAGNLAGQQYGGLSNLAGGYAGMMGGASQNLYGAGNQIWNTSQQFAGQPLEAYLQGQVGQNAALSNAMYGLQGPQAAGNVGQALDTFSMEWPQYQQAMQLKALSGMQGAYNAAGQGLTGSYNMAQGVPTNTLLMGSTPVNTALSAYGLPMQASNQYAGAMQNLNAPWGNIQQNAIPFMNFGQGGQTSNWNIPQTPAQVASGTQGLLTGLQQLQNVWGSSGSPQTTQSPSAPAGSAGNPYGGFYATPSTGYSGFTGPGGSIYG